MELFLACAASNLRELEIDQHIYLTTNSCKRIYYIVSTLSTMMKLLIIYQKYDKFTLGRLWLAPCRI